MNTLELAKIAGQAMLAKKAYDVKIMDIGNRASFADYFVIASGSNLRQIEALADEVEDKLAEQGMLVKNVEGKRTSAWILLDFGDIIVNIFTAEMRSKYNIEKIWGDCDFITIDDTEEN